MKNTIRNILLGASLIVLANPSFATRHEELTDDAPCRVASLQQQIMAKIFTKDICDEKVQDLIKQTTYKFSDDSLFHILHHLKMNEVITMTDNGYERLLILHAMNLFGPERWQSLKLTFIYLFKLFNNIQEPSMMTVWCGGKTTMAPRDDFHTYGRSKIFHKLFRLEGEERGETARASAVIFNGVNNDKELLEIIDIIRTQPLAERVSFAKTCEPLMKDHTKGSERRNIIKLMSTIPQEGRERFIQNYRHLKSQMKENSGDYNFRMMNCLARVPENERELFIEQSLSVSKNAGIKTQFENIATMSSLSFEDRLEYAEIIKSFSDLVAQRDLGFLFHTYEKMRLKQLIKTHGQHFLETARYLSTAIPDYKTYLSTLLPIKCLYEGNDLASVENVRTFYSDPNNTSLCGEVLPLLIQYPTSHWSQVATLAQPLLETSYAGRGKDKFIIDAIYKVAPDQREAIMRAGAPLFNATKSKYARGEIISMLDKLPPLVRATFASEGAALIRNIKDGYKCVSILRKKAEDLLSRYRQETSTRTSDRPHSSSSHEPSAKRPRHS